MNRLSENNYFRKCYLETEEVPTQSVIMNVMSPSLAKVYFKSMTPKLKVLAGLEPPLKGGGYDWYAPPEDLLKGRTILRPLKKEFLSKLGFNGLNYYGDTILQHHLMRQEEEKSKALLGNDAYWKKIIEELCQKQYEELSKRQAQKNSVRIKDAFHEFSVLYKSSINKIESLLLDAAIKEIKSIKEKAYLKMSHHYQTLLKQQATMLYDRYTQKLEKKKKELKEQFICNVEASRTDLGNKVHDINVEKYIAIEKLQQLLECQNLACQIYVAMKEKEERDKLLNRSQYEHNKIVKLLTEEIARNDIEIEIAKEKEKKLTQFNKIWEEKVCQVVKKFQEFIAFSLNTLPEQADFLLNIENLMLMQISTIIDNPIAESLFETEKEEFNTPIPEIRPFYLFYDEASKPEIDPELCLKPCRSSSSQLPVIVINKTCIYAACNNLEEFADKVDHYIDVQRTQAYDLEDNHDYTYDIPVNFPTSQQLLELQEHSSMMQILQKEMPNTKSVPMERFCSCKLPHCISKHSQDSAQIKNEKEIKEAFVAPAISLQKNELSKEKKKVHIHEPKWESYFKFMEPKTCKCAKIAKKTLQEHLPPYMRKMSPYDYPDLPNYEICSLNTLKKIVNKAKGKSTPTIISTISENKTKDVATQYSDQEFEYLCTCFEEKQANTILRQIFQNVPMFSQAAKGFNIDGSLTPNFLDQRVESFVNDRAVSVTNLMKDSPELQEIFKKQQCSFEIVN